jgi:hypothetical protein
MMRFSDYVEANDGQTQSAQIVTGGRQTGQDTQVLHGHHAGLKGNILEFRLIKGITYAVIKVVEGKTPFGRPNIMVPVTYLSQPVVVAKKRRGKR